MFKELTIFSSAICNLKCTYCYIKKEPEVFAFDEEIVNAIKSDEYIKRFKQDFPESINSIESLALWGAEPTIHLDLIASKLALFKQTFPNLYKVKMSSNYTHPKFISNIKSLIDEMAKLQSTKWFLVVQCSIDGTKDINDKNRGIGTTDLIVKNLNMIKQLSLPDNVELFIHNKATISNESFIKLSNFDYAESYFLFFKKHFNCLNPQIHMQISCPTVVEPYYYTKEDGIIFSKVIDNFILLSKKYNCWYVPYLKKRNYRISEYYKGGFCGQCRSSVTMLPNNIYALCHRAGFDIVSTHYKTRIMEYKNSFDRDISGVKNRWITDVGKYKKLISNVNNVYETKSKFLFTQCFNIAKVLCGIGVISPIYKDDLLLKKHVSLFLDFTICMQTNLELNGSMFSYSSYHIPLFFNGAIEKLYNYIKSQKLLSEEGFVND